MTIIGENRCAAAPTDTERIRALIDKHRRSPYCLPISHTMHIAIWPAIERLKTERQAGRLLVLDAGCGTGSSTALLAERDQSAFVLGVDRSAARLRRAPPLPANAMLVRARLEEFWLLVHREGIVFDKTLLLYPNPYPKRWQIKRRWYGHPIFPILLATTRALELRTTEQWYAADVCTALELFGWHWWSGAVPLDDVLSGFERKYAARGQPRWLVRAQPR